MERKQDHAPAAGLSPKLRRLAGVDRERCGRVAVEDLTADEIADLKQIVQRRRVLPEGVSMAHAVTTLTRAEPSHHVARTLGTLVADESQPATARAAAAINLRLIPGAAAQNQLIAGLKTRDRLVRLQAIKSLGTFGDDEALAALRRLRPAKDQEMERQLAFAKALIAHRLGVAEPALEFRRGAARTPGKPKEMIELRLWPKLARTVRADRERLTGSRYGIELGDRGFGLQAGRASWTVLVNREIQEAGGLTQIFERPWITALLARWDLQSNTSAVQYVVLTDPAPRSTEILVVRTDGEIFYSGRAVRGDGLFRFDVRDVERPGTAPTNVKGRLTARGVELDVTVPFGTRKNARAGEPVVV